MSGKKPWEGAELEGWGVGSCLLVTFHWRHSMDVQVEVSSPGKGKCYKFRSGSRQHRERLKAMVSFPNEHVLIEGRPQNHVLGFRHSEVREGKEQPGKTKNVTSSGH